MVRHLKIFRYHWYRFHALLMALMLPKDIEVRDPDEVIVAEATVVEWAVASK
jgi:hypothetical protein